MSALQWEKGDGGNSGSGNSNSSLITITKLVSTSVRLVKMIRKHTFR